MSNDFFYESIHRAYDGKPYIDLDMTNLNYFSHFHDEIELIYMVCGELELHVSNRAYTLKKGEIGVIMPGEIHSYISAGANRSYIIKFFPSVHTENTDFAHLRFLSHKLSEKDDIYNSVQALVNDVAKETAEQKLGWELAVNSGLFGIILLFLRNMPCSTINIEDNKKQTKQLMLLKNVDEYVNRNYQSSISLDDISRHCGYSSYYFSHFFREATGQRFSDYLILFRVEKALTMISSSNKNFTEIALDCGFNNVRSFNRAFQNYLNITPTEYRNKIRKQQIKIHRKQS